MKGQSINIDWTIGLSLFILTALSSVLITTNFNFIDGTRAIEQAAEQSQNQVRSEITSQTYKTSLNIRSPVEISSVPIDKEYYYKEDIYSSQKSNIYTNLSENRFATVKNLENESLEFVYFTENISKTTKFTDLNLSDNTLTNSHLSAEIQEPGLTSLQINSREILNSNASIDLNSDFQKEKVFYETQNNNLTFYNNSKELIVRDKSFSFYTRNFSNLYWHNEGTESIGEGTIRDGETKGFSLGDGDIGITFMGDMNAEVTRLSSERIRIDIESNNSRIRLHEDGVGYGQKRIKAYTEGERFFGPEKILEPALKPKIKNLDNLTEEELENSLNLQEYGYNISITLENSTGSYQLLSRGTEIPLTQTVVNRRPHNLILRNSSLRTIETQMVIWQ